VKQNKLSAFSFLRCKPSAVVSSRGFCSFNCEIWNRKF